jgi:hypothetical protein
MSSTAEAMPRPVSHQLAATVAQAILALLVGLSLVMLVRRVDGAFVQPLSGVALVTAAAGLMAIAGAARLIVAGLSNHVLFALPGIAVILSLAAFTLSGTPAVAIVVAWFLVVAGEGVSWLVAYRPEILQRRTLRSSANRVVTNEPDVEQEIEFPAGLVQQLTRVREAGRESVHATLLAEIPVNDRQAALHIAFCPPLDSAPELTAHALNGDDADVRVTQAESFGARIEVRLPATAAEKRSVLVEVLGAAICR